MNEPKVSVCIPSYNYASFLPEAIESVLTQSFSDFEILIIDDCSSDNTREVTQNYQNKDRRIRFNVNSVNIGMVNNWNLCLNKAEGKYIKFLFADDLLSSADALRKMVSFLDAEPDISLVASARNFIDAKSRIVKVSADFKADVKLPGEVVINRCFIEQRNLVGEPSAVMFRRKDAARGFMPHYRHIVDLEMWFHLLEKGRFAHIAETLCAFRVHSGQQTERNTKRFSALEDSFHLFDEYMNKPYITISDFRREYIRYDNIYRIWKFYRTGSIDRGTAVTEINKRYGYAKFLAYLPLYKIYKPLLKLSRKLGAGLVN